MDMKVLGLRIGKMFPFFSVSAFSIVYLLLEYMHVPDFAVRSSSLHRRLTRRLVYDMKGPHVLGRCFPIFGVPLFPLSVLLLECIHVPAFSCSVVIFASRVNSTQIDMKGSSV